MSQVRRSLAKQFWVVSPLMSLMKKLGIYRFFKSFVESTSSTSSPSVILCSQRFMRKLVFALLSQIISCLASSKILGCWIRRRSSLPIKLLIVCGQASSWFALMNRRLTYGRNCPKFGCARELQSKWDSNLNVVIASLFLEQHRTSGITWFTHLLRIPQPSQFCLSSIYSKGISDQQVPPWSLIIIALTTPSVWRIGHTSWVLSWSFYIPLAARWILLNWSGRSSNRSGRGFSLTKTSSSIILTQNNLKKLP